MTLDTIISDLDVIVTFADDGAQQPYSDDPLSGGIVIESVSLRVGRKLIDITDALTDAQLADLTLQCADDCAAA